MKGKPMGMLASGKQGGNALLIVILFMLLGASVFFLNQDIVRDIDLSDRSQLNDLARNAAYDLIEVTEALVSSEELSLFDQKTGVLNQRPGSGGTIVNLPSYLPLTTATLRLMNANLYEQRIASPALRIFEGHNFAQSDAGEFCLDNPRYMPAGMPTTNILIAGDMERMRADIERMKQLNIDGITPAEQAEYNQIAARLGMNSTIPFADRPPNTLCPSDWYKPAQYRYVTLKAEHFPAGMRQRHQSRNRTPDGKPAADITRQPLPDDGRRIDVNLNDWQFRQYVENVPAREIAARPSADYINGAQGKFLKLAKDWSAFPDEPRDFDNTKFTFNESYQASGSGKVDPGMGGAPVGLICSRKKINVSKTEDFGDHSFARCGGNNGDVEIEDVKNEMQVFLALNRITGKALDSVDPMKMEVTAHVYYNYQDRQTKEFKVGKTTVDASIIMPYWTENSNASTGGDGSSSVSGSGGSGPGGSGPGTGPSGSGPGSGPGTGTTSCPSGTGQCCPGEACCPNPNDPESCCPRPDDEDHCGMPMRVEMFQRQYSPGPELDLCAPTAPCPESEVQCKEWTWIVTDSKVIGEGDDFTDDLGKSYHCEDNEDGDHDPCTFQVALEFRKFACCEMMSANGECRPIGCFDGEVPIAMADGSLRPAKEIQKGDRLLNPVTGRGQAVKRVSIGPEREKPMFDITVAGRTVRVSSQHPFPVAEQGRTTLRSAEDLRAGDLVRLSDGSHRKIGSIVMLPVNVNQVVYNFELEAPTTRDEDHMLLANGIVTGDLFLQEKFEIGVPISTVDVKPIRDPELMKRLVRDFLRQEKQYAR